MKRVSTLLLVLMSLLALGCSSARKPRVILVFADVSASVKDFAVYRDAWSKIVASLHPCDRVILAQISDRTYTDFRPALDYEMPRLSWWRDNKLTNEARLKDAKATFEKKFNDSLAGSRSAHTDIFGALLEAGKLFKGDRREPVLVLLSDMLQDADGYDFEKLAMSEEFTKRVIADVKGRAEIPDLSGASVYVAGASARSTRQACAVEQFWLAYAKAGNARLTSERYGPALLNFGE
jgi:hypothetical protein